MNLGENTASQIAERYLLERAFDGLVDPEHETSGRACDANRASRLAGVVRGLTFREIPRALEHVDQLAERDALRVRVKRVPTSRPTVRVDEPALMQPLQDLCHHGDWQVIEIGDLSRRNDLPRLTSQVNSGEEAVIG